MKDSHNFLLITCIFILFSIFGCSTSEDAFEYHHFDHIQFASNSHMDLDDYIHWSNGKKTLTFYDDENFGDQTQWKVILKDGDIKKLYSDGERLSASEISDNEDYIYDKLEEIEDDIKSLKISLNDLADMDFNFDFDFDFDDDDFRMNINFDGDDFAESMEELGEALSKIKGKKYNYHFDDDGRNWDKKKYNHWNSNEFKKEMRKLKRELRNLEDFEVDIDLDMDEFNESMEELSESLKDININMSGFDDEMIKLKIELKGLNHLKGFLKDMKSELEWDGYINDEDENYSLKLDENEMIVNGNRLPDRTHKKYLKMYEKHFGKELDEGFYVNR